MGNSNSVDSVEGINKVLDYKNIDDINSKVFLEKCYKTRGWYADTHKTELFFDEIKNIIRENKCLSLTIKPDFVNVNDPVNIMDKCNNTNYRVTWDVKHDYNSLSIVKEKNNTTKKYSFNHLSHVVLYFDNLKNFQEINNKCKL